MKIYTDYKQFLNNTTLILGFFDGIHRGHSSVILSAVDYAKSNNSNTVLLTFSDSPAKFFQKNFKYIRTREENYKIIESLGVDYLFSADFKTLFQMEWQDYLKNIVDCFQPRAIFSGCNYTFGKDKKGSADSLKSCQKDFGYEYFCVEREMSKGKIISSTLIKEFLKNGQIFEANELLNDSFSITSKVIEGQKIARSLGYPTANMIYPDEIVKIPHGVYKVSVFNMPAIMNWGCKPTFGGLSEIAEVHIPNYEGNLYGKNLEVKIIDRIRDEQKFETVDLLKEQIKKDIEECLK